MESPAEPFFFFFFFQMYDYTVLDCHIMVVIHSNKTHYSSSTIVTAILFKYLGCSPLPSELGFARPRKFRKTQQLQSDEQFLQQHNCDNNNDTPNTNSNTIFKKKM